MVTFTVYGEPVAQGRPKTAVVNGRAVVYDPAKSRDYKRIVAYIAQAYAPEVLLSGPINLAIKVYRTIPKSYSKAKRASALAGEMRPTTKPDLKNIISGIEDALEQVIFENDSQVVSYDGSGKWYCNRPRVEIEVTEVGP